MNVAYINPFIDAVQSVLEQFGVQEVKKTSMNLKEEMIIDHDVTAYVGIVGELRGNVSYCYSTQTAKKLASAMMMGMPVEEIDDMTRSALAELSNMFMGNAAAILEGLQLKVDITPPSVVVGEEIFFILSFYRTVRVELETPLGNIEVNIGLEI